MRFLIAISILVFTLFSAKTNILAQTVLFEHSACSTIPSQSSLNLLESIKEKAQNFLPEKELNSVPVTVHVVRQTNGLGGVTTEELNDALDILNTNFQATEMEFFYCSINYIDDGTYFDFWESNENNLTSNYNVPNTINLYITNNVLTNSGSPFCGFTHYPGEEGDHIIIAKTCFTNGSTLSHEMGHYFGLYHTHGKASNGATDELNSGTNCVFSGDDVCDTAADPNLLGKVSGCSYTGNDLDANGQAYSPDVNNIMSYAPAVCRIAFSEGQSYRMAYILSSERDYLFCGGLSADFSYDQIYSSCNEALTVNFMHTGSGALTCTWDFGDGHIETITTPNITHTYQNEGAYSVTLTVSDATNTVSKNISQLIHIQKTSTGDFSDSFEDGLSDWVIENFDNGNRWHPIFDYGYEDNTIMCINNFTQNQSGQEDFLISRNFDLSGWAGATLEFDLSYSPLYYTSSFYISDELEVQYSKDCGESYEVLYAKSGQELATTTTTSSDRWFPQSSEDWRRESIEIPSELMGENIYFRIVNRSGQANYLYLDNFEVIKSSAALPVDLVSFTAKNTDKGNIELNWETSKEINTSVFEIEYSKENRDWSKIGSVDAAGQSEEIIKYDFDYYSVELNNYFRLKMIDLDGSFEYSEIKSVSNLNNINLQIFPNPTTEVINVAGVELGLDFKYKLMSLDGKILKVGKEQKINLSDLNNGIYFLQITNNKQKYLEKVIKK